MVVVSFILLGVLLVIVQTTLCMPSPVWWLAPDFSYVLVGYLAYRLDLVRSVIILFPLGCTLDVLSGTVLGLHSLLCYGGYFLLRFVSGKLPVLESLYQIPLVATSFQRGAWGCFSMWSRSPLGSTYQCSGSSLSFCSLSWYVHRISVLYRSMRTVSGR